MPSQGWHKETHPPKEKEQKPRSRLVEAKKCDEMFFSYLYGKSRKTLGKQRNCFASLFSRFTFCKTNAIYNRSMLHCQFFCNPPRSH